MTVRLGVHLYTMSKIKNENERKLERLNVQHIQFNVRYRDIILFNSIVMTPITLFDDLD